MASPLEMYSKFGLATWICLAKWVKLVKKWPMADCYFKLCSDVSIICILEGTMRPYRLSMWSHLSSLCNQYKPQVIRWYIRIESVMNKISKIHFSHANLLLYTIIWKFFHKKYFIDKKIQGKTFSLMHDFLEIILPCTYIAINNIYAH